MSLYDLFNVKKSDSAYDIETAGKSALRQINPATVKQFINKHKLDFNDDDIPVLIREMKKYIDSSASLLLSPETRECYDALQRANTPNLQTLTKARINYINANNSGVLFDNSVFDMLPLAEDSINLTREGEMLPKHDLKCRFCAEDFTLDSFMIYQCKCTARIGHVKCANKFTIEYKNRCPVCRGKLLARREISKYMFWCIENKFKM
tara:strand:+ start:91 stop:711 length:621 start_codon:yes stop_codon:yes gene_type:complete